MGRPEVARQHIPNPDGSLLLAAAGLPGESGAQDSSPQLGRGSCQVQRPGGSTGGRGRGGTGKTPDPDWKWQRAGSCSVTMGKSLFLSGLLGFLFSNMGEGDSQIRWSLRSLPQLVHPDAAWRADVSS